MKKSLSIITPVFNGEEHIESCINNVAKQNCANVEHIIMDGGSTDGTADIIRDYANRFDHINWQSSKDKGQSDAMNKGIGLASGSIISFLNVDDYYEPGIFTRIISLFKNAPVPTLLVGNCNVWNNDGSLSYINKPSRLDITQLLLGFTINPHPVNPSAYFYHKSLHDIIGLYDIEEHYALDVDFILKAVKAAHVKYYDEAWGNFCMLEGAKTVIDMGKGSNVSRMEKLFSQHKKSLSFSQKLKLASLSNYYTVRGKLRMIKNKIRESSNLT